MLELHLLTGFGLLQQRVAPLLGHGRYRLLELLGAGGMALVYRAFDTRLDCERAVKVLKPELDGMARRRFFNEARTMAKLHHKNVVLIHDVADDGTCAYLVMELIEGGSIADRMAAYGPLPQRMACEVAIALLAGLEAAHEQGIVHRDVKPHNILVDADGTPKVTDFGIAQASELGTTRTGAMIGTWAYMAPEQRLDAKSVDHRADVFAAGCTLYNMLTGRDPFDLYNRELYAETYRDVPEPFVPIIQRATRYEPDDRYPTAAAFREDLEALHPSLPEDPEGTPPLGVPLPRTKEATATLHPLHVVDAGTGSSGGHLTLADAPERALTVGAVVLLLGAFISIGVGLGGLAVLFGALALSVPDASREVAPPERPALAVLDGGALRSAPKPVHVEATDPSSGGATPPPVPRAGGVATVKVRGLPRGTDIFFNGMYRGKNRAVLKVPVGEYINVRLTNGGRSVEYDILVREGGLKLCYDLENEAPCR